MVCPLPNASFLAMIEVGVVNQAPRIISKANQLSKSLNVV